MPIKPRHLIDENDPRVSQIGHPAPPWLVNYADLMTELVCFFVILYALSAALSKNIQNAKQAVEKMMNEEKLQGEVKVDREGMRISLEEQGQVAFFESGKADLTLKMIEILNKMTPTLKKLAETNEIVIEGHTDNVPIATAHFASNWELSTARATSVVRHLVFKKHLSPNKFGAIGYGEYRSVASHDTPEHKARNRRVVFFVKSAPPKLEK